MKILIIEDEKKIADSLRKGLQQEKHVVDVSYDGEEGYDLASSEKYDIIILDLMLPKIDGLKICKKLREDDQVFTPILMLTARGSVEDRVKGLNIGADDYLPKPFSFEELLARVDALGRRPKNITDRLKVEVGDLRLDRSNFDVKRGSTEISLSRKEFTLLEYLMRNNGKIVTKDELISNVWSYDADILPNTVEVYIGYLRKKIDGPFKRRKPLIHTVRGFGYKIA
jgi:two-component system OmpR family response regulator